MTTSASDSNMPLNLSSRECTIWSPARSLEKESLLTTTDSQLPQFQTNGLMLLKKPKKEMDVKDDQGKCFPVSVETRFKNSSFGKNYIRLFIYSKKLFHPANVSE